MVAVNHLNKGEAVAPAMYRTMGSLAFVAAARAAWAVVKDKQDSDKRLFLPIENNLAADIVGLSYSVVEKNGYPCMEWSPDPVTMTVDEAMEERGRMVAAMNARQRWLGSRTCYPTAP